MSPDAPRRPRSWVVLVLLGFAVAVAACSGDEPSSSPSTTTIADPGDDRSGADDGADDAPSESDEAAGDRDPSDPEPADDPALSARCPEYLPEIEMACGQLDVPVNYDEPSDATYSLPYVVLPALGDDPSDEPLVFMQGGPGFSTLEIVPFFVEHPEFRVDRDVIFLEQRGTDPSGLFLRCDPGLATIDDVRACRERYVSQGVDLSSFTTLNAARDLASLRAELGIDRWHLLGGSYGTTLAMVAMDNDPEGVASVILDAPTAPDVIIYTADVESLLNAFTKVFDDCGADPDCGPRNPDLFENHVANVERLFAQPWDISGTDLATVFGPTIDFRVYIELTATLLSGDPGALPAFVTANAQRDADALFELVVGVDGADDDSPSVEDGEEAPQEFAQALNFSIYCAEEAPYFDPETSRIDTVDAWPAGTEEIYLPAFAEICSVWDVEAADPADVDQVRSDIPTLILAGEYDHTTPIRQGEIAAAGLTDVELIEVPSTGHTTLDNACARSIMVDFLRAPGGDRSCLDDIAPIVWR